MPSAVKAASIILGLIVVASLGYAGWMFSEGRGEDALPLVISSVVCATFIAVLASRSSKPKE
ncbi:MAG: hypothetical protein RLO80_00760 [Hyphomonas sp.]